MTLHPDSIQWAINFLANHSDGDIFPRIPEIAAVDSHAQQLAATLSQKGLNNLGPLPCRRFLIPKDDLSYRQATQLHPQDSILFTAIIYQFGQGIEARRLPTDKVFSYRFDPSTNHGLYRADRLWNEFWETAYVMSEQYPYILYCDIADFYNQIYHHTVENQLIDSQFPNQAIKWIIELLESTTAGVSRGIPVCPHAVHLIAECTLIPIDNSLTANGIEFIRFADDILIFCDSKIEARKHVQTVASILDKQQRLMLQRHKTEIYNETEFQNMCSRMIEDRPISDEEETLLKIVEKYSDGNPYVMITYDEIDPDDWKEFSSDVVSKIVTEYIREDEPAYIHLRWFFRRLAQVGHPGALDVVVNNINSLEPCLGSVCAYIASVQEIPPSEWGQLGEKLINILDNIIGFDSAFARLSVLSLFSNNEHIDHFQRLAPQFSSADAHTRREILLAANANLQIDWLREHKESFPAMDHWQRMAYIYCVARLPGDEKRYFLNRHDLSIPFENELKKWSRNQ